MTAPLRWPAARGLIAAQVRTLSRRADPLAWHVRSNVAARRNALVAAAALAGSRQDRQEVEAFLAARQGTEALHPAEQLA